MKMKLDTVTRFNRSNFYYLIRLDIFDFCIFGIQYFRALKAVSIILFMIRFSIIFKPERGNDVIM
jgi:hypothetical protein